MEYSNGRNMINIIENGKMEKFMEKIQLHIIVFYGTLFYMIYVKKVNKNN